MLKCVGTSAKERGGKVLHTITLADPANPAITVMMVGGADTPLAGMQLTKFYELAEVARAED